MDVHACERSYETLFWYSFPYCDTFFKCVHVKKSNFEKNEYVVNMYGTRHQWNTWKGRLNRRTVLALLIHRKFQQKQSTAKRLLLIGGQYNVVIKEIYSKTYEYIFTLLIKLASVNLNYCTQTCELHGIRLMI